eukprot:m51a1_g10275 hypothetical protein (494) ;mRNA; r:61779-63583
MHGGMDDWGHEFGRAGSRLREMSRAQAKAAKKGWDMARGQVTTLGRSLLSEVSHMVVPDRHRTFRLISRERSHKTNVVRDGLAGTRVKLAMSDLFHTILNMMWWKMLGIVTLLFLMMHAVFGSLIFAEMYYHRDAITNMATNETSTLNVWLYSVYFSVQAGQSIGFGYWAPVTTYLNAIVCLESYLFLVYLAVLGGFMYAKIMRPSRMARSILFSKIACINQATFHFCPESDSYVVDGTPCLTLRIVSTRRHQMLCPQLRLYLFRLESEDGPAPPEIGATGGPSSSAVWRVHDLDYDVSCMRARRRATTLGAPHTLLPLTVVHVMDKHSPLYKATPDSLMRSHAEIIAVYEAVDEACSSNLQARWSYLPSEIKWNAKFKPLIDWKRLGEGKYQIHLEKFDQWQYVDGERVGDKDLVMDIPEHTRPSLDFDPRRLEQHAEGGMPPQAAAAAAVPVPGLLLAAASGLASQQMPYDDDDEDDELDDTASNINMANF